MGETEVATVVEPAEREGRRLRGRAFVAAALVATGLAYAWLVASAELPRGDVGVGPRGSVALTRIEMPATSDVSLVFVPVEPRDGIRLHVFRSIENTTLVPITIEELWPDRGAMVPCGMIPDGAARATLLDPRGGLSDEEIDAAGELPLTLPPDRQALVVVPLRFGCLDRDEFPTVSGAIASFDRVPMRISVLGWSRTVDLALDDAVAYSGSPLQTDGMIQSIPPTLP